MNRIRRLQHGGLPGQSKIKLPQGPIENAYLPMHALLLTKENRYSEESDPIVEVGAEVAEGQLVARSTGKGSAHLHAPIPGVVTAIKQMLAPGGFESGAIAISLEGTFSTSSRKQSGFLWESLNRADLIHIVQDKGIIQVSNGRPLHQVLLSTAKKNAVTIIINVLEPDDYRRVEERIMELRYDDVMDACSILTRMLQPKRMIFAFDTTFNKARIVSMRQNAIRDGSGIEIERFIRRYPQDATGQLSLSLGLDHTSDLLIIEPSTLIALYDAIVADRPHIEQYVYIAGNAIRSPTILKARIGTPIGDLIEESGGFIHPPARLCLNDPYHGLGAADMQVPVTRSTRAILALTRQECKNAPERPCNRCGCCIRVCPENLDPYLMHKLIMVGKEQEAIQNGLDRCTLCGACASACWSRIPLSERFDMCKLKGAVQ
jgi:electron transport complex protein RnfC